MGFLDRLKKSQQQGISDWKVLETEAQLAAAIEASHEKPVVLFKHSVTCGISAGAKHRLESAWDFDKEELDFYYLDLLAFRPISNKIAEDLGVIHQSPQIIVLRNGKAIFDASHHRINAQIIHGVIA